MPENPELAAALKLAKTKEMSFAFVSKGTQGKLLVDKKRITAKAVAEAKKENGGGTVFRGRVKTEDGSLVFEVAKPAPPAVAAATKKVIKQDAGLTVTVSYRVAADLADEAEEGDATESTENTEERATAPPPPPPPPPPDKPAPANEGAARFTARLKALPPVLEKASVANQAAATQARAQIADANKAFAAKQYDEANAALDRADTLIKQALTSGVKASAGADVVRRLNVMTADINSALGGPNKAQVQAQLVKINGLIKNKDFVRAGNALDELAPFLKPNQATSPPPPPSPPPGQKVSADESALQTEWESRVIALEPKVNEAQKKRPGEAKWMTMFTQVQDLGSDGKFAQALKKLDELEALLNSAPKISLVKLQQCRLEWSGAVQKIQADLRSLKQSLQQTYQGDERLPTIEAAIEGVATSLAGQYESLSDKLDEALNARDAVQRQQLNEQARELVIQMQAYANSDPIIQEIDANGVVPLEIKKTLTSVLPSLAAKLKG